LEENQLISNFENLIKLAKERVTPTIAVAAPNDLDTLSVIERAESEGIANFILVGDEKKIEEIISSENMSLHAEIYHETDHVKVAEKVASLAADGNVQAVMKGMLQSPVFLKGILSKEKGINIGKRITQISITEKEDGGLLFITDCAITVNPNLNEKIEVVENAVNLAHKIGIEKPKVAILAAIEIVNPAMQDTVDAALLSKMAELGQIKGCVVDGPFAFDNAISQEAAGAKGIKSAVAGNADIVVVPNLAVGNALTKCITHLAKKTVIAATVGGAVPIVFTSRTESMEGKLLSIALASCTS
jgi:phosphate butyryltransferase